MIRPFARGAHGRGRHVPRTLAEFLIGLGVLALAVALAGAVLPSARHRVIAGVGSYTCPRGQVALTFDGGPGTGTAQIVRVLQSHGARATFFVTGKKATEHPELIRAETAAGNEVEDNGWDHAALGALTPGHVRDEIVRTQRAIVAAGAAAPAMIRLPYGSTNEAVKQQASGLGLEIMQYSIDAGDLHGRTPAQITATVLREAANGAVVLMHDALPGANTRAATRAATQAATQAALPGIISGLRSAGFCLALASAVPGIGPGTG